MIPGTMNFVIALAEHPEWGNSHTIWGQVSGGHGRIPRPPLLVYELAVLLWSSWTDHAQLAMACMTCQPAAPWHQGQLLCFVALEEVVHLRPLPLLLGCPPIGQSLLWFIQYPTSLSPCNTLAAMVQVDDGDTESWETIHSIPMEPYVNVTEGDLTTRWLEPNVTVKFKIHLQPLVPHRADTLPRAVESLGLPTTTS